MAIASLIGSEPMPPADATLTISVELDPAGSSPTLVVRCSHGTTTLPLPETADAAAERAATTLVVLQHYTTTGCSCTRPAPR